MLQFDLLNLQQLFLSEHTYCITNYFSPQTFAVPDIKMVIEQHCNIPSGSSSLALFIADKSDEGRLTDTERDEGC